MAPVWVKLEEEDSDIKFVGTIVEGHQIVRGSTEVSGRPEAKETEADVEAPTAKEASVTQPTGESGDTPGAGDPDPSP